MNWGNFNDYSSVLFSILVGFESSEFVVVEVMKVGFVEIIVVVWFWSFFVLSVEF